MKAKRDTIDVMFRKYTDKSGEILAVFPYEMHDLLGRFVTCYAHIGQHGSAQMSHVLSKTRPAKPNEYAELHNELKGIYERPLHKEDAVYTLRIIKRRSYKHVQAAIEKARR